MKKKKEVELVPARIYIIADKYGVVTRTTEDDYLNVIDLWTDSSVPGDTVISYKELSDDSEIKVTTRKENIIRLAISVANESA